MPHRESEPKCGRAGHVCPNEQLFEEYWLGLLDDSEAFELLSQVKACEECWHRNVTARKQAESLRRCLLMWEAAEATRPRVVVLQPEEQRLKEMRRPAVMERFHTAGGGAA